MNKPFGVMASAVFALLGSLLMLAFCVLASLVLILPAGRSPMLPEAKLGLVFGIAFFGILGAWERRQRSDCFECAIGDASP
jgi:hypothetical protein